MLTKRILNIIGDQFSAPEMYWIPKNVNAANSNFAFTKKKILSAKRGLN